MRLMQVKNNKDNAGITTIMAIPLNMELPRYHRIWELTRYMSKEMPRGVATTRNRACVIKGIKTGKDRIVKVSITNELIKITTKEFSASTANINIIVATSSISLSISRVMATEAEKSKQVVKRRKIRKAIKYKYFQNGVLNFSNSCQSL